MKQELSSLRHAVPGVLAFFFAAAAAAPDPTSAVWTYRVRQGDTLIGLQQRLLVPGADWRTLQRLNDIADPRRLPIGSRIAIPVALLRARPVRAEVVFVHGEVLLRGADGERPLTVGQTVGAGDEIVTAASAASAVLRLDDGSQLMVEPGSRLRVESLTRRGGSAYRESTLRLEQGGAEASVVTRPAAPPQPRLRVKTPLVNLAVRGTEFRARSDAAGTRLEVLEGRVAAGSRAVGAGLGIVATVAGVQRPRPLLPAPALSEELPRVERMPLALDWAPVDGAASYRAQVLTADGNDGLLLDGRFTAPAADWPDALPDGRYRLRVRAADAGGLEGRDAVARFELKATPEPPMPLAPPTTGDAGETTFRWTRNPEAAHYRLQIAAEAGFDAPLLDRDTIADTALQTELPVGRYQWRLRSVRAGGDAGPWGVERELTLVEPPPQPPAEPPSAEVDSSRVALAWAPSPRPGARYEIQVAHDPAFTEIVAQARTDDPAFAFEPPGAGTYHVRVRSIGQDGRAGAFGTAQQVDVPARWRWWWLLPALLWLL